MCFWLFRVVVCRVCVFELFVSINVLCSCFVDTKLACYEMYVYMMQKAKNVSVKGNVCDLW